MGGPATTRALSIRDTHYLPMRTQIPSKKCKLCYGTGKINIIIPQAIPKVELYCKSCRPGLGCGQHGLISRRISRPCGCVRWKTAQKITASGAVHVRNQNTE